MACTPEIRTKLLAQLASLEELAANWNGEGALAPSSQVIRKAISWVRRLPSGAFTYAISDDPLPPAAVPSADGTVQVEFHGPGRRVLELEFRADFMLRYLRSDPADGISEEGTIAPDDIDRLIQLIDWSKSAAGEV